MDATTAARPAPMMTVVELEALLAKHEADQPRLLEFHVDAMRQAYAKERELIQLAIKAATLAMTLGADTAREPDLQQRLSRDIRDGLVSRVRRA